MSWKNQSFTARIAAIVALSCLSAIVAYSNCVPSNGRSLTVEDIRNKLRDQRDKFVRDGRFVDVFPALYFESTDAMILETRMMNAEPAQLLSEQIRLFYNAYEANRSAFESEGASAVESHWKAYYREAVRLEGKKEVTAFEVIGLILDGVDAHLTDLPRSIRYQLRAHPDSVERLKILYFQLDKLFPTVVKNFDADVAATFGKRGISVPPFSLFNVGANYVTHARHNAWEAAAGNEKLRAKKPQPRLCREQ